MQGQKFQGNNILARKVQKRNPNQDNKVRHVSYELKEKILNLFEYLWIDIEPYRVKDYLTVFLTNGDPETVNPKNTEYDEEFTELYVF